MRFIFLALLALSFESQVIAQDVAKLDRESQGKLRAIAASMSEAMKAEDEAAVRQQFERAIELMGDQAGLPESPDEYRAVPKNARTLSADELPTAFDAYIPYIERQNWWRIGLDPSKTNHSLREVATVIEGCLAASQISEPNA